MDIRLKGEQLIRWTYSFVVVLPLSWSPKEREILDEFCLYQRLIFIRHIGKLFGLSWSRIFNELLLMENYGLIWHDDLNTTYAIVPFLLLWSLPEFFYVGRSYSCLFFFAEGNLHTDQAFTFVDPLRQLLYGHKTFQRAHRSQTATWPWNGTINENLDTMILTAAPCLTLPMNLFL